MSTESVSAKPENPFLANFRPYIPAGVRLRELTPLPLIIGTLLGMVFGASSLYLVLKVGLTVSASIPVAVISITVFRVLSKIKIAPIVIRVILAALTLAGGVGSVYFLINVGTAVYWVALVGILFLGLTWLAFNGSLDATILENNIVQTAGSAGESIAFGVGVTMPAIMILGLDLEVTRVMLVALLGGLLGILMMIPLRRALIVAQHGQLKYPEGTACAEVLKAGASEESRAAAHQGGAVAAESEQMGAKTIFAGLGIGFLYQVLMTGFKGWKDTPEKVFGAPFKAGSISAEISPALLGVGYIIGPRIASIICAGGVLAYLVLIPAIKFFGSGMTTALAPGTVPISEMSPSQIRGAYVLYIGAGAVAAGGADNLAWTEGRLGRSSRRTSCDRRRTAHRSGSFDEDRVGRDHRPARLDHDLSSVESALEHHRSDSDRRLRFPVRHSFVAFDGRNRLVFESDFGNDGGYAAADVFDISGYWLDWPYVLHYGAFHRRHRLHRFFKWRHHVAGFEDRIPGWLDSEVSADCDPGWGICVGAYIGPDSFET